MIEEAEFIGGKEKKWIYFPLSGLLHINFENMTDEDYVITRLENLSQYIGEKAGEIKIYDGDIVRIKLYEIIKKWIAGMVDKDYEEVIGLIENKNGCWAIRTLSEYPYKYIYFSDVEEFVEVLGNKFENPELIKDKGKI